MVVPLPADPVDRALVHEPGLLPNGSSLLERALAGAARVSGPSTGTGVRVVVVDTRDDGGSPPADLDAVRRTGGAGTCVVVLDPLCALVPLDTVEQLVGEAVTSGRCTAAVLPVTDTLKRVHEQAGALVVAATLDRDACLAAATPVVVPPGATLRGPVPLGDPADTLAALLAVTEVSLVQVGEAARRLHGPDDVAVRLAGPSGPARGVPAPGPVEADRQL